MADESGNAMHRPDSRVDAVGESQAPGREPGFEKYLLPGPWTEEDERMFEFMVREFGEGHGGRDSDL